MLNLIKIIVLFIVVYGLIAVGLGIYHNRLTDWVYWSYMLNWYHVVICFGLCYAVTRR